MRCARRSPSGRRGARDQPRAAQHAEVLGHAASARLQPSRRAPSWSAGRRARRAPARGGGRPARRARRGRCGRSHSSPTPRGAYTSVGCHGGSVIAHTRGQANTAGSSRRPRPPRSTLASYARLTSSTPSRHSTSPCRSPNAASGAALGQPRAAVGDVGLEQAAQTRSHHGSSARSQYAAITAVSRWQRASGSLSRIRAAGGGTPARDTPSRSRARSARVGRAHARELRREPRARTLAAAA